MAISASIQALLAGEQVAGSRLNSKLLDELSAEGLLLVIPRGSRKSYRARDMEALKRFLIDKDESFRIIEANASDSRATMACFRFPCHNGCGDRKFQTCYGPFLPGISCKQL